MLDVRRLRLLRELQIRGTLAGVADALSFSPSAVSQQLSLLEKSGVPLDRVILSHTDKVVDRGYHRELLSRGAWVVYDQGIRTQDDTARLVRWMVEDGFSHRLLLGTDGARRSLWKSLGGEEASALLSFAADRWSVSFGGSAAGLT